MLHLPSILLALTLTAPAQAAADAWSPLQEAGGHAIATTLGDGTTVLVSTGGEDEATVYEQRRAADGTLGALTEVMTVPDAEYCRPVDSATALGDFAVGVECYRKTAYEEPPMTLAELVWTGDDGWVWQVRREGTLASIDWSPQGQYVLFAAESHYGRPHHFTSYHPDLGWRDLTLRQFSAWGDDVVAAIDDQSDVTVLRGAGFEDEPGYWFGGRLTLETYDASPGVWKERLDLRYPSGGIRPTSIDLAGGHVTATAVRSRSTGRLHGRADRLVVLAGSAREPRLWSPGTWSRGVLSARAATTQDGVGVLAWQAVIAHRSAKPWLATWAPGDRRPVVEDLTGRTTLTDAAEFGHALDLSVTAQGHGVVAWSSHRRAADSSTVTAASFGVGADGVLGGRTDTTWQQPVSTTVDVTASAGGSSLTLGRLRRTFVWSPTVQYAVGP